MSTSLKTLFWNVLSSVIVLLAIAGAYYLIGKYALGHDLLPSARAKELTDITRLIEQTRANLNERRQNIRNIEVAITLLREKNDLVKEAAEFASTHAELLGDARIRSTAAEFSTSARDLLYATTSLEKRHSKLEAEIKAMEESLIDLSRTLNILQKQ